MSALTGPCRGDSSRKQQQRGTPHRTHSLDSPVSLLSFCIRLSRLLVCADDAWRAGVSGTAGASARRSCTPGLRQSAAATLSTRHLPSCGRARSFRCRPTLSRHRTGAPWQACWCGRCFRLRARATARGTGVAGCTRTAARASDTKTTRSTKNSGRRRPPAPRVSA